MRQEGVTRQEKEALLTGIDGNCPTWPGASAVYSRAYAHMEKHGADYSLIEALGEGDEETIGTHAANKHKLV